MVPDSTRCNSWVGARVARIESVVGRLVVVVGDRLVVVAVGKPVGTEERGAGTRLARKFDCKTLVVVGRYLLQVRRSSRVRWKLALAV